jgi:hypothetical protein
MAYGRCQHCGDVRDDVGTYRPWGSSHNILICSSCEPEVEAEGVAAVEAEYEEARMDLADDIGMEYP